MGKRINKFVNFFVHYDQTKRRAGNIWFNISATARLIRFIFNGQKATKAHSSAEQVEQAELKTRYSNARYTAFGLLAMLVWAFASLLLSKTAQGFFLGSFCSLAVGMYYIALCRALYKTRLSLSNWPEALNLAVTWADYFNSVAENPKNLFPRNIKN
jgi:hypothetical protein